MCCGVKQPYKRWHHMGWSTCRCVVDCPGELYDEVSLLELCGEVPLLELYDEVSLLELYDEALLLELYDEVLLQIGRAHV